jgi:hypothetical protein
MIRCENDVALITICYFNSCEIYYFYNIIVINFHEGV